MMFPGLIKRRIITSAKRFIGDSLCISKVIKVEFTNQFHENGNEEENSFSLHFFSFFFFFSDLPVYNKH